MKKLHEQVLAALADRQVWEGRQRLFYIMRHDGLPRRNKPFQGAADLHFPLIDTSIEKLKPFYFNQAFAAEHVAQFVSKQPQAKTVSQSASECLDYELKEESDFDTVLLSVIDTMLERGRGILKQWWDAKENRLRFKSINPVFFVVADGDGDLDRADWFCEIKVISLDQYRRNENYNQNEAFIKRISGQAKTEGGTDQAAQEKYTREGLTFSNDRNKIVLYEHYKRNKDGWTVRTWSPNAPELPVRAAFPVIYQFQGKPFQPYTDFVMEIKDAGWYAPRGVAERLAPFEASICKMWNEKHDWMSFHTKPLFERDQDSVEGTVNFRFRPGEVLPRGVRPIDSRQAPIEFDQEINSTRNIAEQSIAIPDAGVAPEATGGDNKQFATATQINFQQALASTGVDLKGGIFRIGLGKALRKSWALIVQFKGKEISYFVGEEMKSLPSEALHDLYLIKPSGSPSQWNRTERFQRAFARYQTFKGDPGIDQDNLKRDLLSADDGRLVKDLLITTNQRAANEERDEAEEILLLVAGFPVEAQQGEDHQVRLQTLKGYFQAQQQLGIPIPPVALQRLQEHAAQHMELAAKEQPSAGGTPAALSPPVNVAPMPTAPQVPEAEPALAGGPA
jgi:hypothetical protein